MARITITADCIERLEGFLVGVAWTNDSALAVQSVDADRFVAVLVDQDADDERHLQLGSFGLAATEQPDS